jgi:hypothetical protein
LPADRTSFSPGDEIRVRLLSGAEMLADEPAATGAGKNP